MAGTFKLVKLIGSPISPNPAYYGEIVSTAGSYIIVADGAYHLFNGWTANGMALGFTLDYTNGTMTATTDGSYYVSFGFSGLATGGTEVVSAGVYKSGSIVTKLQKTSVQGDNGYYELNVTGVVSVVAGDVLDIRLADLAATTNDLTFTATINADFTITSIGSQGSQGLRGEPGVVQSVVAGSNVTVDSTDPANPIVASSGGGSSSISVVTKTANYTLTSSEDVVLGNTSGGSFTLTLPTAVGVTKAFTMKKIASGNTLNIATTAAQTIDGSATIAVTANYESITVVSNNSNWEVI